MKFLLLFMLMVCASTSHAQSRPANLPGLRLLTPGNPVSATSAGFAIGLSTDGGQRWRDSATSSELVQISGFLRPESGHVGVKADIFVVDQIGSQFFMLAGGGLKPWNGQVAALQPHMADVTLTTEVVVDIYRGRVGPSLHRIFLGYMADDGVLIYTPAPQPLGFSQSSGSGNTGSNNTGVQNGSNWQASAADRVIKSIGFDLRPYDPATNRAGDMQFTQAQMSFNRVFFEYGFVVPANSAGPEKSNPQPTFILPLGTKVRALVDGTVSSITKLYSNDFSVMLQAAGSELVFEMEHVIKVQVAVGDKVKAGDVVAEVSDYDAHNYAGLGLLEIGVLKGSSGLPLHLCPFDFLDPSVKEATLNSLTALMQSWELYRKDTTIHDEAKAASPGCMTLAPIEG
jgi:hypothetical protein